LDKYANKEIIEDQKKKLKRTLIRWDSVKSLENQVYLLIDQFRKIDETISEKELVENIIKMVPVEMQRNLSLMETEKLDILIKYMKRLDKINIHSQESNGRREKEIGKYPSNREYNDQSYQDRQIPDLITIIVGAMQIKI